tara:strand:+ start:120 stop:740 length:621 start_codon:yes stop_codon:yes gene_type:complete
MKNEQEKFWSGSFGNNYIKRNNSNELIDCNENFFKTIFKNKKISQCLEIGSNIGLNLIALKKIFPGINLSAIEINTKAVNLMKKSIPDATIYNQSFLNFDVSKYPKSFELVFTKTVLIHISPKHLKSVYNKIYKLSNKYILLCEYYNPTPVEVEYRKHKDKLFKRDFAGEMLYLFKNLNLINYGFAYKNDPNFPQDDINWFLMEKK